MAGAELDGDRSDGDEWEEFDVLFDLEDAQ